MKLHHIHRTTFGGRIIGDILIEEVTSTEAMKYAAVKYPGERLQYVCSIDPEVPIIWKRKRTRKVA